MLVNEVGDLQPILAEVGEATRRLAMLPRSERETLLEQEIARLRQRLQNREVESLNLDEFLDDDVYRPDPNSPVSLANLESLLTGSQATGHLFQRHPEIPDAYLLTWQAARFPVTFSRECFDAHPDTVRFLSYVSSLFAELLASVPVPEALQDSVGALVRCQTAGDLELCRWYTAAGAGVHPVETLAELQQWLSTQRTDKLTSRESLQAEAQALFDEEVSQIKRQQAQVLKHRQQACYLAERAKAQRLLLKAAMVEIALAQQLEIFDAGSYPAAFDEQAVIGLQRHGFPWGPLLKLAYEPGLSPKAEDPYYQQIAGDKREALKARLGQLKDEAKKAVQALSAAHSLAQGPLEEAVGDVKAG